MAEKEYIEREAVLEDELLPCKCGNEKILLTNWGLWRAWCPRCLRQSTDELTQKDAKNAWNTCALKNDGERREQE